MSCLGRLMEDTFFWAPTPLVLQIILSLPSVFKYTPHCIKQLVSVSCAFFLWNYLSFKS